MYSFKTFLKEEAEEGSKLKHITHAEDRPLQNGSEGFKHAIGALNQAHEHIKSGGNSSHLTMKYDGSPSLVFGHHPETGKFFVASKSAFNKNPKINYTGADIAKNHGHAPGLMDKLHAALTHLKKVTPKSGVYQGDAMFSGDDVKHEKGGKASFTPNTIKYTATGDEAEKVKKAKFGIVVHTQYHGDDAKSMKADPHPDLHNFGKHPDVWMKSPHHDTKNVHYSEKDQAEFNKHINSAKKIHNENKTMYRDVSPHAGEGGQLEQYINHTVRTGEKPEHKGFSKFLTDKSQKESAKLKTPASQGRKSAELKSNVDHIGKNKKSYDNMFKMHQHLQDAKNILVKNLNQHTAGLEHHVETGTGTLKATDPEGYVVHHAGEPTKLVNRQEFSRINLLKVRK